MDFQLPAEDDPRRLAIREWLAANPSPTGRQLAEAGYVAPHWPAPWGLGADPIHQIIIDDELLQLGRRAVGVQQRTDSRQSVPVDDTRARTGVPSPTANQVGLPIAAYTISPVAGA